MLCFFPVCFSHFTCFAFPLFKAWVSLYGRHFYFALITFGWVWHQWTGFTTCGCCTWLCGFVNQSTLFLLNYFVLFPYASHFFLSFANLLFSHLYHQFCFRDQLHAVFSNTQSQFICAIFHKLFPYFMFLVAHFFFLLKFNIFFFNGTALFFQVLPFFLAFFFFPLLILLISFFLFPLQPFFLKSSFIYDSCSCPCCDNFFA